MVRVAIIEDELAEYERLSAHLAAYGEARGVSFSVAYFPCADDFIEQQPAADLIFMDIDMPGTNGLDGARAIRGFAERVPLVFVTNLAQYAIRGYEVDAVDFMVKPVGYGIFSAHMERIMRVIRQSGRRSVAIKDAVGTRMVAVDDIVSVESDRHYLIYRIAGEREAVRVRGTLSATEAELGGGKFVRLSVSCLVNADHIVRLLGDGVVLDDGSKAFFSRSRKKAASRQIADYFGGDL